MKRPFVLGLTGSIGMGKSTTAAMFAAEGVPTWNADSAVSHLYGKGGRAVEAIGALFEGAVVNGAVSRGRLKAEIEADPRALAKIEAVVHPLVAEDRKHFIESADTDIVVVDVPLLFEIGGDADTDAVVVVSVPEDIQRKRVMARPWMTEEMYEMMLARQMPDAEKRKKADYIIETLTMDGARQAVRDLLEKIRGDLNA